jgi:hypothetical protein
MLTLLALSLTAAAENPPEVGLTIEPLVALDASDSPDSADSLESWLWIRAKAKQRTNHGTWFFAVNGEHNVRVGEDTEAIWRLDVGETGWSGKAGPVHLKVGNLVERWGKLDLTPIINVLNPSDLRAGPLATIESMHVAVPMAVVQAGTPTFRAELSFSPFPQGDRVDMMGSDWSLIRPGMLENFITDAAAWPGGSAALLSGTIEQLGVALEDLQPSTMRALSGALGSSERPQDNGLNGNLGARVELEGSGLDVAFVGANIRSAMPQTRLNPAWRTMLQNETLPELTDFDALLASPPIGTQWPRTWMAGAELSTILGPLGVRAEGGWWSDKVVQQQWLSADTSPAVSVGGGIDWAHGSAFFVSIEGRWSRWLEAPPALFLTAHDTVDLGATGRLTFAADRMQLLAAGLYSPTFNEWMLRPELSYRVSDPISIGVGGVWVQGNEAPPSTLLEVLRYAGGPMSMMSDNDVVFATLRWIQ